MLSWSFHGAFLDSRGASIRVVSWCLHGDFIVLSWSFHGPFMVLSWCFHSTFIVLSWCFDGLPYVQVVVSWTPIRLACAASVAFYHAVFLVLSRTPVVPPWCFPMGPPNYSRGISMVPLWCFHELRRCVLLGVCKALQALHPPHIYHLRRSQPS